MTACNCQLKSNNKSFEIEHVIFFLVQKTKKVHLYKCMTNSTFKLWHKFTIVHGSVGQTAEIINYI